MEKSEVKMDDAVLKGIELPIMEAFYTIQGEGFNTGKSAYFIRLAGCDVGCHWCDVKESWNKELYPNEPIEEITQKAIDSKATYVVITGGEPLMHNLDPLCKELHQAELKIFLETSGAHPLTGQFDWICLSPKKRKHPLDKVFQLANELKVVIFNKHDFIWAEENAKKINLECKLYLQPEWSKMEEMMPQIIEYVKDRPEWEISLQTHKFMQIP